MNLQSISLWVRWRRNKVTGKSDEEMKMSLLKISFKTFLTRGFAACFAIAVLMAGLSLTFANVSFAKDQKVASASAKADAKTGKKTKSASESHSDLFAKESYPRASQCGACHTKIYKEWASSNHAYASISPMFHKFEQRIYDLTQGTMGSFCVRCHQQVGTQRGEPRELPLWERSQVAREGITCVTCHRVNEEFGKVNGERRIVPGNIHKPVYGTAEGSVFSDMIKKKADYKMATNEKERGAKVHAEVFKFSSIKKSEFCVSCHQVAVNLGIKLEVVWEQYRDSPAFKAGVSCQDCHMGKVPGRAEGYDTAPVAIVNGKEINPGRKHSNHAFYGPGYPIAHPGIFPHNPEGEQWSIQKWLKFDYRAGWGTPEFEEKIEKTMEAFSPVDDATNTLGVIDIARALDELKGALKSMQPRVSAGKYLEYPLNTATEALNALGEVVENDGKDAEARDELVKQAEVVRAHASTIGNAGAAKAASSMGATAGKFKGTWASGKAVATVNAAKKYLKAISKAKNSEGRLAAYQSLVDAEASLRKAAAPGLKLASAVSASKAGFSVDFPTAWTDPGDREEARAVVEDNLVALEEKRELRRQVMENGGTIDGPFFSGTPKAGGSLDFKYVIKNTNSGHNLPSGSLGAQPEVWLNVALTDPDGKNIWESGYVDSNGDFADNHSLDVAAGKIKFDKQLFNLQTKFLTTNVKGTDREMYLPVSFDIDQRPLLRPAPQPTTVINHPPFARMEGRSMPPLSTRNVKYSVPRELMKKPGKYKLSVRMRTRAEPIYFMRFVQATPEMERTMNQWMLDVHPYSVEFDVK